MNLYAESSAVLSWLLGEGNADVVREILARAELVLASELTLIECDRVLIRAVSTGRLSEGQAADRHARLNQASNHWAILRLDSDIVERARRPFPSGPIRTLDALHLATALVARSAVAEITLLTLDHRVRSCGRQLGFELLPAFSSSSTD